MPLDALQLMQGYRARDLANMGAQQRMDIVPQQLAMQQQADEQAVQRQKALADMQGRKMMQDVQKGRQLAAYQAAVLAQRDRQNANATATAAAAAAQRKAEAAALEKFRTAQLGQKDRELTAKEKTETAKGESGLAGETAGKIAMADQAVMDLRDARKLLFEDDGKGGFGDLKRWTVAAMNIPFTAGMPGNADARNAYSKMRNAIAAKYRIETGAAGNKSEEEGLINRFLPRVSDPTDVVRERLDRLEEFMNTTIDETKGVRLGSLKSRQSSIAPPIAPPTPAAPTGIPPAAQRTAGQVYDTPKGKLKWTGTGWVSP